MAPPSRIKLTFHERAKVAARARWGPPRVVRLDALTPCQREVVLALIALNESRKAADAA